MKNLNLNYVLALLTFTIAINVNGLAQWSSDPLVNTTITNDTLNETSSRIISDGQGGAIIVWQQSESSGDTWLYAQRLNSLGFAQWQTNGVLICGAPGSRNFSAFRSMVSDGGGGAIIVWVDQRNGIGNFDIYAQRINGSGVVQWSTDGLPICILSNANNNPDITTDGDGGAIISWNEQGPRLPTVYAQRVSNAGTILWQADGVPLSVDNEGQLQSFTRLVSDGTGGAIIVWEDHRAQNGMSQSAIWGQHVDSNGNVLWDPDGIDIGPHGSSDQYFNLLPQIISDGSDGAIVTWWQSYFDSTNHKSILAKQVSGSGSSNWVAILCEGLGDHQYPNLVEDGSGGAIVTWYDNRNSSDQIFSQRVDNSGNVQWTANGIPIKENTAPLGNVYINPLSDNAGGAIVVWNDYRAPGIYPKIFAQRCNSSGSTLWQNDGIVVCSYDGSYDPVITNDGYQSAIVCWYNARPADQNIYAQQINENGQLGIVTDVEYENQSPATFSLNQNFPNPFNPSTKIKYSVPTSEFVTLKIYDVLGNEVATLVNEEKPSGSYEMNFNANGLSSGIYFYKLNSGDFIQTKKMILLK